MSVFPGSREDGASAQKQFFDALLRAAVARGSLVGANSEGTDVKEIKDAVSGLSESNPAFDTVDLIVRAIVQQEGALSRVMSALSDTPSMGPKEVTDTMSTSRTFVSAPEVILFHFVCRMLEEAEQQGRYGVDGGRRSYVVRVRLGY